MAAQGSRCDVVDLFWSLNQSESARQNLWRSHKVKRDLADSIPPAEVCSVYFQCERKIKTVLKVSTCSLNTCLKRLFLLFPTFSKGVISLLLPEYFPAPESIWTLTSVAFMERLFVCEAAPLEFTMKNKDAGNLNRALRQIGRRRCEAQSQTVELHRRLIRRRERENEWEEGTGL